MFVQKSGRVDDWTCLKSSCQKLLLLFNCGFDSTLHWIKQIRYCFSENARPSLKILWPTQLWVSQWKTHKCRKNTKTITGITFLPAISQTGAQTAVDIFWSFCVCVATLHSEKQKIGLNMVTKRAPIRADHHPVLIWWLYFDVIRSPYLEHDVNTHTPLMVMHYEGHYQDTFLLWNLKIVKRSW